MERVWINLPDTIFAEVKLPELFQLFEIIYFSDLVVGSVQNLEIFHWC